MRIKRQEDGLFEADLTPMIDMTFQLIAFFMVLLSFSQNEPHLVQVPESEIAKPPPGPLDLRLTLHLPGEGNVIIGANEVPINGLNPFLRREANAIRSQERQIEEATIVIRADKDNPAGLVRELIEMSRGVGFVNFALRAKEDGGN